ncbi:hypothetical protein [Labrys sp. ZIDIC5]|uniref:hypothetical protein n=1 Tax=Labrys sedimenti TaxID=3106036 RepID=UPI002ACAE084|nr:hypothetical protein [Labrys sp. ZIDIC5]MDZ5452587.1 hypothetical protein [Labrys sp. ZIDIC5]
MEYYTSEAKALGVNLLFCEIYIDARAGHAGGNERWLTRISTSFISIPSPARE